MNIEKYSLTLKNPVHRVCFSESQFPQRDNCKTIEKFDKKSKTMVCNVFLGKKGIAAI